MVYLKILRMKRNNKESQEIVQILGKWGNFEFQENLLYLYNNNALEDKVLVAFLKFYKINIQLNLFT